MSITIHDIHVVYRSAKRVTEKQIGQFEEMFGAALPLGYRQYLETLGHGWVNDWLQVYLPETELVSRQRDSLVHDFSASPALNFQGAKLKASDLNDAVQIGIDQNATRLFACPRFPGSVFEWSGLSIVRHKRGFEQLDFVAGMRMERFAYFLPLSPIPENRSLAYQSKKLPVEDVVQTLKDNCEGDSHVVDVDEDPGPGSRSPAFWIFPEQLGVMFHVYGVESARSRRIYLTFRTSPRLLPKVDALVQSVTTELGAKFKPALWH